MSKRKMVLDSDLIFDVQSLPSHPPKPSIPYHQGQQAATMKRRGPGNPGIGGAGAISTASYSGDNMSGGSGGTGAAVAAGLSSHGGFGADAAEGSNSSPNQPPAKKSRTNTPWSPAEEQKLKSMRDAQHSWAEIAKTFPTRTEGSVKKHWYKDMHYAEFGEDESAALLNAIKDYETNKWKVIGQKVGKPAKACEQHAKEHFANRM